MSKGTKKKWQGSAVRNARAYWVTRLPLPCFQCGGVVSSTEDWVVEHIIPRMYGGTDGVDNQWVSHRYCSDASGGRLKAKAKSNTNVEREVNSWPF